MSANPPKHDRWQPYPDARFVLIRNVGRLKPSRGLILDWRREGVDATASARARRNAAWEALVVYLDDAALRPVVKTEWLPARRLVPVPVDPNLVNDGQGRR